MILFFIVSFIFNFFIFVQLNTEMRDAFLKIKKRAFLHREEKKITNEIPNLIDFLKSYLYAGLLPIQAISHALRQKKWCHTIRSTLGVVLNSNMQGKSLNACLTQGILKTQGKESRKYLHLLLSSLRLGCDTGANLIQILEKVQSKTEEKIQLERKIKVATAQIRLQALIIILAPFFLAFILYFLSPAYILFFIETQFGNFLLLIMIILNIIGAITLKSILKLE